MEHDPDFRRYVRGFSRIHEAAEQKFMGTLKPATSRLSVWATLLKPEVKYNGRYSLYPYLDEHSPSIPCEASLGLYIAKAYWGRGPERY